MGLSLGAGSYDREILLLIAAMHGTLQKQIDEGSGLYPNK